MHSIPGTFSNVPSSQYPVVWGTTKNAGMAMAGRGGKKKEKKKGVGEREEFIIIFIIWKTNKQTKRNSF